MASQQKLGLRTERWSGIGRTYHHHSIAPWTYLIDWKSCVEVRPDAVIWKVWMTPLTSVM